ncbi:T9SS type B sorting domain-containing protein [Foetidibacter luteolus]|uniref:T9SS type B sorting domain-containing protein n=1 Tax=Foetidibacter luteolus TaxID=2608880 RepID=UPI00129B4471|nr:T9SS type B sorting domain-containing protein [Foetidibacter luteolus]
MKQFVLLVSLLLISGICACYGQDCPPNLDFENGDFSHWECLRGITYADGDGKNIIELTDTGVISGRHEILTMDSASSKDPYGNFPKLCPYGGKYSVKLGNDNTGAEAEGLRYTFTVPSTVDTFTFTYFYAVVFQDPNHSSFEQPRFFVTAYDVATNEVINCASFTYISNGTLPGFEKSLVSGDVLFKNWSPVSLQFAGLQGRTVALEFKTADCTLGGHFGYAYVDVASGCTNILATAPYCAETNSLLLNAPYGFQTYTWYNQDFSKVIGNHQSITLSPPPAVTGSFYVDVIPYPGYGCRDTFQATVLPLPVPPPPEAKPAYTYCQFTGTQQVEATALPGNELLWYTADTLSQPAFIAPQPSSSAVDTFVYYVSQKVLFGCESFRKKVTVAIDRTPVTSFVINSNSRQCQNGNQFAFSSTSTNLTNSVFTWILGNKDTISSAKDSVISYSYKDHGNYYVKLRVTNSETCSDEMALPVTVVPKPIASFTHPPVICEQQTLVNILNTSQVPDWLANINKWWWRINNTEEHTEHPVSFTPGAPGSIQIEQVVTTEEGCRSDTNRLLLPIYHRPQAAFTFSQPLCNNEIIRFTDASFLPQGATGQSVSKWHWQFANPATSQAQHPAVNLVAGLQTVSLVAESNYGCMSIQADSLLLVHPKPHIALSINDSCIKRYIHYKATDLSNSVNKWYWDFGNGFNTGDTLITRIYSKEGNRPLTLMAETIHHCKDTIVRPFVIYDNKAFAGKDTVAAWDQPVQLNANGGPHNQYTWTPALGLDNPFSETPVATLDHDQWYQLDALTDKGCDAHSKIFIKRYDGPELYVPTGFTPNGDGRNDVLKVIPAGTLRFDFFAVFNRAGQRLFYTKDYHKGWDGYINGNPAPAETYIAYAVATDYKGKPLVKKVPVVLIR